MDPLLKENPLQAVVAVLSSTSGGWEALDWGSPHLCCAPEQPWVISPGCEVAGAGRGESWAPAALVPAPGGWSSQQCPRAVAVPLSSSSSRASTGPCWMGLLGVSCQELNCGSFDSLLLGELQRL